MDTISKDLFLTEINNLIELNLLNSAESIATLFLTSSRSSDSSTNTEIIELLGDIAFKQLEYKRALNYYKQAAQQRKLFQNFKSRSQQSINNSDDSRLKYKECKCLVEMNELVTAQKELESIPSKYRDLKMNVLLGTLLKNAGLRRPAVSVLREALGQAPFAVEVIEALVSLGVEAVEITGILDDSFRDSASPFRSIGWLHSLVNALVAKRNYEHDRSAAMFEKLSVLFPKNMYLLTHQAEVCACDEDQWETAVSLYRQVRRLDAQLTVRGMEGFAKVLFRRQDEAALNRLASEVLELNPRCAAGWLAAAMFCCLRNEHEQSSQFIDKVII